jgi:hypothetical protein
MSSTYLLAKALAYAIVAIELRPETIREQSDYDDMVVLFRKLPASEREMFLDEARRDLTGVSVEDLPANNESPPAGDGRHAEPVTSDVLGRTTNRRAKDLTPG